jgi:hypothetical protein
MVGTSFSISEMAKSMVGTFSGIPEIVRTIVGCPS